MSYQLSYLRELRRKQEAAKAAADKNQLDSAQQAAEGQEGQAALDAASAEAAAAAAAAAASEGAGEGTAALDAAGEGPGDAGKPAAAPAAQLDAVPSGFKLDDVIDTDLDITASSIVQEWVETDDLEPGEGMADRLLALMVGALPEGEFVSDISDEAADDLMVLGDAVGNVLASLGVSDDDITGLIDDYDNDVADRVVELVAGSLEDGADPVSFVMGDGSDEAAFDSAVYRVKLAIRGGKKTRVRKRVSGTVILNAAQKTAVRKMQIKSRTSLAKARRARSMRARQRMGI